MMKSLKFLERIAKILLRIPADLLVVSSKRLPREIHNKTVSETFLSAKFLPYRDGASWYAIPHTKERSENQPLPYPPKSLWEGFGETKEEDLDKYMRCGKEHVQKMKDALAADGFKIMPGQRILELGCAAGRMLRWFQEEARHSETWGVDISAEHILWCQQNLTPPFHFMTATTQPHLPFPDAYFDLIYAGSVFTHIADLADAWLLELKRMLNTGGRLYITIHDERTVEMLTQHPKEYELAEQLADANRSTGVLDSPYGMFCINRSTKSTQVFYNMDYFSQKVSRWFKAKSIHREAYGYQTAILLEK